MYPKKTLSAASLLSECERKRRRSLEARGCAKSESEFSMGTAATCPFKMSEQSPRTNKQFPQYVLEVTIPHYDKLKLLITYLAITAWLNASAPNSPKDTYRFVLSATNPMRAGPMRIPRYPIVLAADTA